MSLNGGLKRALFLLAKPTIEEIPEDLNRCEPVSDRSIDPRGTPLWVLAGAAVGFVMAIVVFDSAFFFGDAALVEGMAGDAGSSFAGFRYFVNDAWRWPLLETESMVNAQGTPANIALTDSIPLLALLAKTTRPLGVEANSWIGIWYYGCFIAQGASAALAVRTLGARSMWTGFASAVLASTAPVLFLRIWHPGLLGHFTLFLTWAAVGVFYQRPDRRSAMGGTAALCLAVLVHPYFFAMAAVVIVGTVATAGASNRFAIRDIIAWAFATASIVAVLLWTLGYIPSKATPAGGFGAFGTSIIGPIWPQWSWLRPGNDELILSPEGSFEGVAWLGAGGAILVLVTAASNLSTIRRFVRNNQVLMVFIGVLVAVAVTPMVQIGPGSRVALLGEDFVRLRSVPFVALVGSSLLIAGGITIWLTYVRQNWRAARPAVTTLLALGAVTLFITALDRRVVWDLLQQFRASGRFFWIVGYGMVLGSLVIAERRARGARFGELNIWLPVLMSSFALIQVVDTARFRTFVPDALGSGSERVDTIRDLAQSLDGYQRVRIASSWFCTSSPDGLAALQDVVIAASLVDVPVSGYYGGRTNTDAICETTVAMRPGEIIAIPQTLDGSTVAVPEDVRCTTFTPALTLCEQ